MKNELKSLYKCQGEISKKIQEIRMVEQEDETMQNTLDVEQTELSVLFDQFRTINKKQLEELVCVEDEMKSLK